MKTIFTDIRFGMRGFLNNPAFTIIAVLTLALGVGANTALFSVVDAVIWRPLPFAADFAGVKSRYSF